MRLIPFILLFCWSSSLSYGQGLDIILVDTYQTDNTIPLEIQMDKILSNRDSARPLMVYVFNDHNPFIGHSSRDWEGIKDELSQIFPGIPDPNSLIDTLTTILPQEVIDFSDSRVHYFCSSSNALLRDQVHFLLERFLLVLQFDLSSPNHDITILLNQNDVDFSYEKLKSLEQKYVYNIQLY